MRARLTYLVYVQINYCLFPYHRLKETPSRLPLLILRKTLIIDTNLLKVIAEQDADRALNTLHTHLFTLLD